MKKWEKMGLIVSIVAVVGTLGFSIWDKIDYRRQIVKNEEQIAKTAYDKLYSDVAQGRYSGTKLKDAIKRILEHGDDLSGMNLSKKWLDGINLKGENLYVVNFSASTFYSKDESTENEIISDFSGANLRKANLTGANLFKANLQGVEKLTIGQLSKAKTLYKAKLDDKLMEQVKKISSSFGISEEVRGRF